MLQDVCLTVDFEGARVGEGLVADLTAELGLLCDGKVHTVCTVIAKVTS